MKILNFLDKESNLCELELFTHIDERGLFRKVYSKNKESNLQKFNNFNIEECFYSISMPHVLRGFHLQISSASHDKIVTCVAGKVLDVVVDLRHDRNTFGNIFSIELDEKKGNSLFIPRGFGHAFLNISNSMPSNILYLVSSTHSSLYDVGVKWDSVKFKWPMDNPLVSKRDNSLPSISEFKRNEYSY